MGVKFNPFTGKLQWFSSGSGAVVGGVRRFRFTANGYYTVDTEVDGSWISDVDFTVTAIWVWRETAGSAGSTILDVNKNGTTMYTTQGNRPTIEYDDADNTVDCTLPDVVAVTAGDIITVDIDEVESGVPQNVILIIEGS